MMTPTQTAFRALLACAILLQVPLSLCRAQDSEKDQVPAPTLEAKCPGVIGDHAIFQQGIPVPIWGKSLPRAKVTVRFVEQNKSAVADDAGRWRVALDSMKADKLDSLDETPRGRTLTIVTELDGKRAQKEFDGILVGEVWLCSGQSNMAGKVRHNHANQDPNDNLLESNLPAIRHISAPGGWQSAVPGSVHDFTRVGFCFARKVQRELKVPIGLVNACRGGSNIESWMRVPPKGLPEEGAAKKKDAYGGLYRERIVPLIGYGMRGALWYQGEANASEGHSYYLKMQSLIGDWRSSWKQGDFPFYFVQLAGIGRPPVDDNPAMGDGRARIREAQRRALSIKNTGMAVAVDIGADREHPANKVEVGQRLAHWALHHDYNRKKILPTGPLYKKSKIEGNAIRISFDHAQGLMLAEKKDYAAPVPAPGKKIPWLSIQAKDGSWHWAVGKIDGDDLVVSSKDVKEPVAVRYAYTNRPLGPYLYNKAGLPASPFDTSKDQRSAKTASGGGKHLFILSGQSNMAGMDPGVSFKPAVIESFGEGHVLVVKDASSGSSIRSWCKSNHEFPPPTTGRVPKVRGELYGRLLEKVKKAIGVQCLQSVTLVWMQGESDLNNTAYDAYLKELLEQLQADLAFRDLNVVIGRISDSGLDVQKRLKGRRYIRRIQEDFAEAYPRGAWVDTDDLNDRKDGDKLINDLHYTEEGYRILGARFAEKAIKLIESANPKLIQ